MAADGTITNMDCSFLLSAVGVRRPSGKTVYELRSQTVEANFSAFGLWQLLPEERRPRQIWFVMTPQARQMSWDLIQADAQGLGVQVKPIDLADEEADDPQRFLEKLASALPDNSRIVLNVTEGLRHHAFLYYALALYLTAFRKVTIEGVWYCRLETAEGTTAKPVIDLKPVFDLAQWFHAIRVFQSQGVAYDIAELLEPFEEQLRASALEKLSRQSQDTQAAFAEASRFEKARNALRSHAFAYACGLPLEVGKAGHSVVKALEEISGSAAIRQLPLASTLFQLVAEEAGATCLGGVAWRGDWKSKIELTSDELLRQAELIEKYCRRGQWPLAAGLMREWAISWLMYQQNHRTDWLSYARRKPFEAQWGVWANLLKNESDRQRFTEEERQLCDFWAILTDQIRNTFHHHGMRVEPMEELPHKWQKVYELWHKLVESLPSKDGPSASAISWPKVGGGKGKLLICPVGLSAGVLYSAICHVQPARVLIVGSQQTVQAAQEAYNKAAQEMGLTMELCQLALQDAHTGVGEFDKLVQSARQWLCDADEVHVSLTGGTALMGVLVVRLADTAARDYLRPVHRFVLIDKRPPEEQRAKPWVKGDFFSLDTDR